MSFSFKVKIESRGFYGAKRMYEKLCKDTANRRVEKAGKYYLSKVKENSSVRNYSLRDLKQRGHPYATKYGRVQYRKIPPLRRFQIHTRSGKFLRSIRGRFNRASSSYTVFLQSPPKHAEYLIFGTRYMLPRDVFAGTFNIEKKEMRKIILGKIL